MKYNFAGGSDDWAKASAKIKYAYTMELRDTGSAGKYILNLISYFNFHLKS